MKKVILLILPFLFACTPAAPKPTPEPTPEPTPIMTFEPSDLLGKKANMSGYRFLSDRDHVFIVSSVEDMAERADRGEDFAVYFGYDTCPWCNEAVPLLNEAAKANGYQVGYINVYPADGEPMFNFELLVSRWEDQFTYDENGEPNVTVPFVFFFKDGEVAVKQKGTVEGHNANERRMTEEENAQLKQEYMDDFALISK